MSSAIGGCPCDGRVDDMAEPCTPDSTKEPASLLVVCACIGGSYINSRSELWRWWREARLLNASLRIPVLWVSANAGGDGSSTERLERRFRDGEGHWALWNRFCLAILVESVERGYKQDLLGAASAPRRRCSKREPSNGMMILQHEPNNVPVPQRCSPINRHSHPQGKFHKRMYPSGTAYFGKWCRTRLCHQHGRQADHVVVFA